MVLLKNNRSKNFGKRIGQANGMMNGNGMMNVNAFTSPNGVNGPAQLANFVRTTDDINRAEVQNAQLSFNGNGVNAGISAGLVNGNGAIIDEDLTTNQAEERLELDIDAAVNPNGTRFVSITDEASGAQVVASIPQAQQQAAVTDDICEFPAQSVDLEREVFITNTTPQIVDVNTDICGNVVSYRERMTRNMNAGNWVATNSAQLAGPIRQFSVNPQGTIINGTGDVRLANSTGLNRFTTQPNVVSQQLVGGRPIHKSNVNASFGAERMKHWRGG